MLFIDATRVNLDTARDWYETQIDFRLQFLKILQRLFNVPFCLCNKIAADIAQIVTLHSTNSLRESDGSRSDLWQVDPNPNIEFLVVSWFWGEKIYALKFACDMRFHRMKMTNKLN
jgi:hypothetical protein